VSVEADADADTDAGADTLLFFKHVNTTSVDVGIKSLSLDIFVLSTIIIDALRLFPGFASVAKVAGCVESSILNSIYSDFIYIIYLYNIYNYLNFDNTHII
jgi:hypothetical protein